ncbi:hypothetical protein VNO80_18410 [Phaseolus coccineus]|uniref:Uncharacterized protein n=1 Tax=Phaseolus coccineus TaxID=3886 RepID=A0AAN9MJ51_PHACN
MTASAQKKLPGTTLATFSTAINSLYPHQHPKFNKTPILTHHSHHSTPPTIPHTSPITQPNPELSSSNNHFTQYTSSASVHRYSQSSKLQSNAPSHPNPTPLQPNQKLTLENLL